MKYKVAIYCSLADRNLIYKGRFYSSQLDLIADCLESDGCVIGIFIFLKRNFGDTVLFISVTYFQHSLEGF